MPWDPGYAALVATKPKAAAPVAPAIGSRVFSVDASAASTLWQDAGATSAAANGHYVARINDAFGVSTPTYQQTAANDRPQLLANLAGGRPGLRFDGASDWMRLTPEGTAGQPFQGRSFTFVAVYRRNMPDGSVAAVWCAGNSGGGQDEQGWDQVLLETEGNHTAGAIRTTGSEFGGAFINASSLVSGQLDKVLVRCSQTDGIEVRQRSAAGAFSATGGLPTSADSFTWDASALAAGFNSSGSGYPSYRFKGDIMEVSFWAARATDAQMGQLETYLDAKWGA